MLRARAPGVLLLLLALAPARAQELLALHPAAVGSAKDAAKAGEAAAPREDAAAAGVVNVTGTYRGSWTKLQWDAPFPAARLLERETGALLYRLTTQGPLRDGVLDVEGDMIMRDGELRADDDVTLSLQGVYVPDSRRLHAVLQPKRWDAGPALDPQDFARHSPAYREALREVAWSVAGAGAASEGAAPLLDLEYGERLNQPRKRCEFVLDLAVLPSGAGEEAGAPEAGLLEESEAGGQAAGLPRVRMNGTLHSEACGLALALNASSTRLDVYYTKAVNYTLMITSLAFLQIMLLLRQMEATASQALMAKVSLLTIGQQAILDAYLCMLHLTTGVMVDPLFNAFATAAFFEFVSFAIFEMRYLLTIWRARRAGGADPWSQHRQLSILYARFYSALLGGIFLSYQLQRWMKLIVFGVFSFWVPQIWLSAREDARQPLRGFYIVGTSLARLALPLYLYGCPHNLLGAPPAPALCCGLAAWVAAQALVLLGQSRFGPRFFVPRRFLPPKYDYHRPSPATMADAGGDGALAAADIETGEAGAECVICMNPVDAQAPPARMLTPCGHFYHPACLQRWMDVKMECPTCRAPLPPL